MPTGGTWEEWLQTQSCRLAPNSLRERRSQAHNVTARPASSWYLFEVCGSAETHPVSVRRKEGSVPHSTLPVPLPRNDPGSASTSVDWHTSQQNTRAACHQVKTQNRCLAVIPEVLPVASLPHEEVLAERGSRFSCQVTTAEAMIRTRPDPANNSFCLTPMSGC